jgi:hypothetical protein
MRTQRRSNFPLLLIIGSLLAPACASLDAGPEDAPENAEALATEIAPPFTAGATAKEDRASYTAIAAERYYYSTQVWEIKNQWEDRTTTEARRAGLAWGADSGLTWDEKYRAWVKGLRRIRSVAGYYDTFEITAPYGKTLPAPVLECAETAIFLRAVFASWHGLPFYLEATDSSGRRTFLGHFGWRTSAGRYGSSALYKTAYKDYSGRDVARDGWPSDGALKAKKLAGASDDQQPFISADARFGAYLDALLLNKRVGHFLIVLLDYFGSANLASGVNTYNLRPEAVSAGDVLVERWQRSGIGHTLVVKNADPVAPGSPQLMADLVSGSMPRRQPKWEESVVSKSYFTNPYTGGSDEDENGVPYAKLGGGLKRFRVTKKVNGYWANTYMTADAGSYINSDNIAAIGARPAQFATLLGEPDPTALRDALLRGIEDRRAHLMRTPASCSARQRREELFRELYAVMANHFGLTRAEVDRRYRTLADYVFAELDYTRSKTCCWNSTTPEMATIVMEYAQSRQANACTEPVVFKATGGGGYEPFRAYAAATGRAAQWRSWSEDEPCSQRGVSEDTEAAHEAVPYCSLGGGSTCTDDRFAGNTARASARVLASGTYGDLRICSGKDDWFKVSVASGRTATVNLRFSHAAGDLDMVVENAAGSRAAASEGTSDVETVTLSSAGDYYVRVFGYSGASNGYRIEVSN